MNTEVPGFESTPNIRTTVSSGTSTPPKVEVTEERLRAAWDKWVANRDPRGTDETYDFDLFKKELGLCE